jgi:hypothetical protein
MAHTLLAIQGQLNYDFAPNQQVMYITDTTEIASCTAALSQSQEQNALLSQVLIQRAREISSKDALLAYSWIGMFAVILIFVFILVAQALHKKKGATPEPTV